MSAGVACHGVRGVRDESIEVLGVGFSEEQATCALVLANRGDSGELASCGVGRTAARRVLGVRPFDLGEPASSLRRLARDAALSRRALRALRESAQRWWQEQDGLGVSAWRVQGARGYRALDLANHGTLWELAAVRGVGPRLADRILDVRAAHGPFRSLRDVAAVQGVTRSTLRALGETVGSSERAPPVEPAEWEGLSEEEEPSDVLSACESLLSDVGSEPMAGFYVLLGPAGYERFVEAVLEELTERLACCSAVFFDRDGVDTVAFEQVRACLGPERFLRPFELIPPADPVGDQPARVFDAVADALVDGLGRCAPSALPCGEPFEARVACDESAYLAELGVWRDGTGLTVHTVEHPAGWVFRGRLLGMACEVRVDPAAKRVVSVRLGSAGEGSTASSRG